MASINPDSNLARYVVQLVQEFDAAAIKHKAQCGGCFASASSKVSIVACIALTGMGTYHVAPPWNFFSSVLFHWPIAGGCFASATVAYVAHKVLSSLSTLATTLLENIDAIEQSQKSNQPIAFNNPPLWVIKVKKVVDDSLYLQFCLYTEFGGRNNLPVKK